MIEDESDILPFVAVSAKACMGQLTLGQLTAGRWMRGALAEVETEWEGGKTMRRSGRS